MKETSMSTRETNVHFREHDVEFLQKRTKLWLESVLGETYGDRTLPELISDGNLLYRVSKHIMREMTGGSPGPQEMSPPTPGHVSESGKTSGGKYLPYSHVDAFLKACRKVGLTDIELFSPPDVVESKDIRPVCTCIRTLARKARAQHIRVPDFEDLNRPLPMPKEKVEEIKGSLQHSRSSPVIRTAHTPEGGDIPKSERVQIVRRFLSATTNPLYVPEEDVASISSSGPPSPATPGPFSTKTSPPSTPIATIGGIGTPVLMKSVSTVEPSPNHFKSVKSDLTSSPHYISSNEAKLDEALLTESPSPDLPDDSLPLPSSRKSLGSFRHANPHFIKDPTSRSNAPVLADDQPVEVAHPHPQREGTLSSPEVSTPTTPAISSGQPADSTKESPSLAHLGLGKAYRHASPHFSFKKSSEAELTVSQDLQTQLSDETPEADTAKVSNAKSKAPSSNKTVEKDPRSTIQQTEVSGRGFFSPAAPVVAKDPASKPEAKVPRMQLNIRHWMPLVAGALAFVGTILVVRSRYNSTHREPAVYAGPPDVYEVQEGDTLSTISKRVGKKSWDELLKLNPSISNPNLIYPSERLKLSS